MASFITKRILWFIPSFLAISALVFSLKTLAPGDPVEYSMGLSSSLESSSLKETWTYEREYGSKYQSLGLDLPVFYFSLRTMDSPYRSREIPFSLERNAVEYWSKNYHNPVEAFDLYRNLNRLKKDQHLVSNPDAKQISLLNELLRTKDLAVAQGLVAQDSLLNERTKQQLLQSLGSVIRNGEKIRAYLPSFRWHGFDNQYHQWLLGLFEGDLGTSYSDSKPVAYKVWKAFKLSSFLGLIAIVMTFLIAVPLGVFAAARKDSLADRIMSLFVLFAYAIPSFLVATFASIFLTTPEYAGFLDWFPTEGLGGARAEYDSFAAWLWDQIYHVLLPIFCIIISLFAIIQQQTRGAMLQILDQSEYIKAARAKGLKEYLVVWKHGFRAALLPLITFFTGMLPAALTGIVTIEYIFNLPGLGRLMVESLNARDWPVVLGILMLSSFLVMVIYLLGDVLYSISDPRISYKKKAF